MFGDNFSTLNLQLQCIQDNLLRALLDVQVDLDCPLVTVGTSQLEIVEGDGVIDGLDSEPDGLLMPTPPPRDRIPHTRLGGCPYRSKPCLVDVRLSSW